METTTEKKIETFFCDECEENYNVNDSVQYEHPERLEKSLCSDCFYQDYDICENCAEHVTRDHISFVGDNPICGNCFDEVCFWCRVCDNSFYRDDDYAEDNCCNNCWDEPSDDDENYESEMLNRNYNRSDNLVDEKHRAFSCEIEVYGNYDDFKIVKNNIDTAIGITDDGSLGDGGKEFITPKLSGEKGEKVLKQLCTELVKNNARVDRSCGLHIHLDTKGITGDSEKIRNLWLFYLVFEPVIFSYLPMSRRKNRYCLPISEMYHEKEITSAYNLESLESIWYREQDENTKDGRKKDRYDVTRYAGINLHSLFANGHIEIRFHSGTIDYKKITNWVKLHTTILDRIASGSINQDTLLGVKYALQLSEKQELFFGLLNLSEPIKNYFIDRQKKFGTIANELKNICVE